MNFRIRSVYLLFFVLPIVFWLYNPFELYFLNDDGIHIFKNSHFRFQIGPYYRPMSDLSLFVDLNLYGTKAWGYHLTNLLLHLACTIVLYFFTKRCLNHFTVKNAGQIAGLACCFFFIYAFHSEAVLWIIGRGGSLSVFFAGLSLIFFLDRFKNKINYWLSLFFFVCGLFAYESVLILPFIVTLFIICSVPWKNNGRELKKLGGYWLVFLIFLLLRKLTQGSVIGNTYAGNGFIEFNVWHYLYNYAALFLRSFIPPGPTMLFVSLSIAVLCILMAIIFYLLKRKLFFSYRRFIWMSFLLSLVVYVLSGIDTHDTEGERFLYMPSFFLSIILADLLFLIKWRNIRVATLIFWIISQLFFLSRSAVAFKYSSQIAKNTIEELNNNQGHYNHLYLIDIPTQYRGAFIFRTGFEKYIEWLAPGVNYRQLTEVSQKEVYNKVHLIKSSQWNPSSIRSSLEKTLVPDSINADDALLVWTDSSFLFVK